MRTEGREQNFVDEDKTFNLSAKKYDLLLKHLLMERELNVLSSLTFWKWIFTINKQTVQREYFTGGREESEKLLSES